MYKNVSHQIPYRCEWVLILTLHYWVQGSRDPLQEGVLHYWDETCGSNSIKAANQPLIPPFGEIQSQVILFLSFLGHTDGQDAL